MSAMVNGTFGPLPLESVQTAVCSGLKSLQAWKAIVLRAMGRSGLSQKQMAFEMGLSPQQLSNQLADGTKEQLSFWKMLALPEGFWSELLPLIAEFHGISLGGMSEQDRRDLEYGRAMRHAHEQRFGR